MFGSHSGFRLHSLFFVVVKWDKSLYCTRIHYIYQIWKWRTSPIEAIFRLGSGLYINVPNVGGFSVACKWPVLCWILIACQIITPSLRPLPGCLIINLAVLGTGRRSEFMTTPVHTESFFAVKTMQVSKMKKGQSLKTFEVKDVCLALVYIENILCERPCYIHQLECTWSPPVSFAFPSWTTLP